MSSNNRASLLAGLRTGGVRQSAQVPQTAAPTMTSFPRQDMPMSAAIGGSFNHIYSGQAQAQLQARQQAIQLQMMQMELMRLQVLFFLLFFSLAISVSIIFYLFFISISINDF